MKKITVLPFVAAAVYIADIILMVINGSLMISLDFVVISLFILVMMFILSGAFSKHHKNVQKTMIGALTATFAVWQLRDLAEWMDILPLYQEYYGDSFAGFFTFNTIDIFLLSACMVLLFINALLLAGDHGSRPGIIAVNKVSLAVVFLLCLAGAIVDLITFDVAENLFSVITNFSKNTFILVSIGFILFVEIQLDMFKAQREQAAE